jgi:hypothetical protein
MSWIKASNKNKEPTKPTKRRLKQKHKKEAEIQKKNLTIFSTTKKKKRRFTYTLSRNDQRIFFGNN